MDADERVTFLQAKKLWPNIDFSRSRAYWEHRGRRRKMSELNKLAWRLKRIEELTDEAIEVIGEHMHGGDPKLCLRAAEIFYTHNVPAATRTLDVRAGIVTAQIPSPEQAKVDAFLASLPPDALKAFHTLALAGSVAGDAADPGNPAGDASSDSDD